MVVDEPQNHVSFSIEIPIADARVRELDTRQFMTMGFVRVGPGLDGIIGWPDKAEVVIESGGKRTLYVRFTAMRNKPFVAAFLNDKMPSFRCHALLEGALTRDGTARLDHVMIMPPLSNGHAPTAKLVLLDG